ncbi:hypothetical protein [Synechococcus sp. MW101C3]|uniref:hypothetical protein n=1 Tax=Synechococcus sp. MW101C3 TaxID=210768 RepID=UPI0011819A7B|nr:hypothetical protein [Synechococcus sp. MW101C3]
MNDYWIIFKFGNPGLFGLPDGDTTVMKSTNSAESHSDAIDMRSGHIIAYGAFSRYREPIDALTVTCELGTGVLSVNDNFFRVSIPASDKKSALRQAVTLIDEISRFLCVEYGCLFPYQILQVDCPDGEVDSQLTPSSLPLLRVTFYDLDKLKTSILQAANRSGLDDEKLSKALLYHEHAVLLYSLQSQLPYGSPHQSYVITSAYMHIWKSITVLLGDPANANDRRDYQSRSKKYGLKGGYWEEKVKPILNIRNSDDVAHYTLNDEAHERVKSSIGSAIEVSKEVIHAYSAFLRRSMDD